MDCPKCKTPNPQDSAACSLCGEAFLKKAAAPTKPLVLADVETEVQGWRLKGPLILLPDGLTFFIEHSEFRLTGPARLAAMLLGQAGGLLGGKAVDAAVDAVSEGQEKPRNLTFTSALDQEALKTHCLGEAPRLAFCRQCVYVPRGEVRAAWCPEDDRFLLRALGCTFEVTGELEEDALTGRLRFWGYPVKPFGSRRSVWAKTLTGVVALAGALAVLADVYEAHHAGNKLLSLEAVRRFTAAGEGFNPAFGGVLGACAILFVMFLALRATWGSRD